MSVMMFYILALYFHLIFSVIQQEQSTDANLNSSHSKKTQIYAAFLSNHTFLLDLSDNGIYISCTNTMCTKENSFGKILKLYYVSTIYSGLLFLYQRLITLFFFLTTE